MNIQVFNPRQVADQSEEMAFEHLATFDLGGAGVFWSSQGGPSPWEMHPDCDEMLHVIEGEIEVEVLPQEGGEPSTAVVKGGSFVVIPRGCWHRQYIRLKTKEFYLTPGRTLHSQSADPRLEA